MNAFAYLQSTTQSLSLLKMNQDMKNVCLVSELGVRIVKCVFAMPVMTTHWHL